MKGQHEDAGATLQRNAGQSSEAACPSSPGRSGHTTAKARFTLHWSIPSGWRCQNEVAPCLGNTEERERRKKKRT